MKSLFLLFIAFLLMSCGPALKEDGSFGKEVFVGKFHGTSVYKVETPDGQNLYMGVNESNEVVSTSYKSGKSSYTHAVIVDEKTETEEQPEFSNEKEEYFHLLTVKQELLDKIEPVYDRLRELEEVFGIR